jgi:hypothetical protein
MSSPPGTSFAARRFWAVFIMNTPWRRPRREPCTDPTRFSQRQSGRSDDIFAQHRWVQRYAPVLNQRIRRELRRPNRSWRVAETYVKVAGDWAYLYRAVDSVLLQIQDTEAGGVASV